MEMLPASCSAHDEARCCGAGAGLRVLRGHPMMGVCETKEERPMNGMFPDLLVLVVDH